MAPTPDKLSETKVPAPKPRRRRIKEAQVVDLVPDAWPRFERFIKAVAKTGPKHRDAKPLPKPSRTGS